ncbi:MAG: SDR family NAD(P)-dependent oxidoreductase [Dehalococcoidia bacterium]|nr:SDR family NAD(P)-dependent oxidoreductase [Dehalococcoidia bacterium]MCB9486459.1 SDR family NAD(P)-dependent oxidoreductase [Thermoflexaceae bacterium]
MGKLDGKHVIVTGSSRGIGKAIAELFAQEGANIVCAARTLQEGDHPLEGSLSTTVKGILDAGGQAHAIAVDLSQYEECVRLVDEARAKYGPIDIVVNNAALTYFIPIKDYPINRWHRSFAVNFHAPFYLSQLALQDMIPRQSGAIVNISSGAAIGPGRGPYTAEALAASARGGTLYGAEKAALERFTQGLAAEVYNDGISVTCVSPSQVVPTPGTVFHKLVTGLDDPRGEDPMMMAQSALLLATEPLEKVTGRVTYDQEVLLEFGWIKEGRGTGIDRKGSGYSQI